MNEANATVEQIQVSEVKREPMVVLDAAQFKTGHGIEGDRHSGRGTGERQVLLMDAETLAELGIDSSVTRENVTTKGLDLAALTPGKRVQLGESAVVEVTGDCEGCASLETFKPGLRSELDGRRGVLGKIVTSGTVRPGDAISIT
jgi:MOSC domain-containing protein YiiM